MDLLYSHYSIHLITHFCEQRRVNGEAQEGIALGPEECENKIKQQLLPWANDTLLLLPEGQVAIGPKTGIIPSKAISSGSSERCLVGVLVSQELVPEPTGPLQIAKPYI